MGNDMKLAIGTEAKTVVLVGRIGSGKSSTGNSIIGANVFDTMPSSAGGTTACQLQRTVVDDGQILNVIDTPGFKGTSFEPETIARCINMAKDGIHAFLVVVSVKTHFSAGEASSLESLKQVFGSNICDYMIVVFTHSDVLTEVSVEEFLAGRCPEPLKRTLQMCGNRYVNFENVTDDRAQKSLKRKELLCLIDAIVDKNGGAPFTNELFVDSPEISRYGENFYEEAYEEKNKAKHRERILELEKQLAVEQVARIHAEAKAQEVQIKSSFEINMLKNDLDEARREAEELRESQRETEVMLRETKEKFNETERNFDKTKEKFKEMEQNFAVKFKKRRRN